MLATRRSIADAGRWSRVVLVAALFGAAAWAQSNKPLDLRVPKSEAPPAGGATCPSCGEVRSIREVNVGRTQAVRSANLSEQAGSQSSIENDRLVGAVVYLPLGQGTKSDESWRFGAAGTPEMQARLNDSSYEITVAMDNGERRVIQRRDGSRFQVGQRVTLRSGELEPMYP